MILFMRKFVIILILVFNIVLLSVSGFIEQEIQDMTEDVEFMKITGLAVYGEVYTDIGEVELFEDAGLTPDNLLYFIDEILENFLVGGNPEKDLEYKEEKISRL